MKKFLKLFFSVVLLVVIFVVGWNYYIDNINLNDSKKKDEIIKIACVGDSITFRHGFENEPENNYPYNLEGILGEKYEVVNFGESGTCVQSDGDCPYVEQKVYQSSIDYDADIIIFMLGTNDSKEWNWESVEKFRAAYETLLETYINDENAPEVYIGISPKAFYINGEISGAAGFGIQPAIVEQIVEIQRSVAKEKGYNLIDIYSLSVYNPEFFAEDGIHPTKEGALNIAKFVAEAICDEK